MENSDLKAPIIIPKENEKMFNEIAKTLEKKNNYVQAHAFGVTSGFTLSGLKNVHQEFSAGN